MDNALTAKDGLTDELAIQEIKNAVQIIRDLKPAPPEWYKPEDGKILTKGAFDNHVNTYGVAAASVMGFSFGFFCSAILGSVSIIEKNNYSHNLIITLSGLVLALATSLPYMLADSYGGSKAKQPIRKFFAKLLRKNRMELLEQRATEYEEYQKALELHQIVIADMRQELEAKGVFELLAKDGRQHLINAEGQHEIEIVDFTKLPRENLELSQKMIEYLKNKEEVNNDYSTKELE